MRYKHLQSHITYHPPSLPICNTEQRLAAPAGALQGTRQARRTHLLVEILCYVRQRNVVAVKVAVHGVVHIAARNAQQPQR